RVRGTQTFLAASRQGLGCRRLRQHGDHGAASVPDGLRVRPSLRRGKQAARIYGALIARRRWRGLPKSWLANSLPQPLPSCLPNSFGKPRICCAASSRISRVILRRVLLLSFLFIALSLVKSGAGCGAGWTSKIIELTGLHGTKKAAEPL